ncbi:ankyrin repeat domain-containing protein 50 [Microdochium nivale]|nr:ankyrin repeat domain-containing protein 50 [Microdochium nivale]
MMPLHTGLLKLPVELVTAIASNLRTERDMSHLSRSNRSLHVIIEPLLYRDNVRYWCGSALLEGIICGNLVTAEKAINWGGADVAMIWSTSDPRLKRERLLDQVGGGDIEQRHPDATQLWNGYARFRGNKFTPLDFAVLYRRPEALLLLLDHGAIPEPDLLHMAAHVVDDATVAILLQHRRKHSLYGHYHGTGYRAGKTLLALALHGAHLPTVRVILDDDPDAARRLRDVVLATPWVAREPLYSLVGATQALFEALVTLVNTHGARVHEWGDAQKWRPGSLCLLATEDRDIEKLKFLLDAGLTEPRQIRRALQSCTALHTAARKGEAGTVRFFLSLGLDDDEMLCKIKNGWTVLEAALRGSFSWPRLEPESVLDTVRALLEHPSAKRLLAVKTTDPFNMSPVIFYFSNIHGSEAVEDSAIDAGAEGVAPRDMWCARTLQALVDAGADMTELYGRNSSEQCDVLGAALSSRCPGCCEVAVAQFSHERVSQFLIDHPRKPDAPADPRRKQFEKLAEAMRLRQLGY